MIQADWLDGGNAVDRVRVGRIAPLEGPGWSESLHLEAQGEANRSTPWCESRQKENKNAKGDSHQIWTRCGLEGRCVAPSPALGRPRGADHAEQQPGLVGLDAAIMRSGYADEYDCCPPDQLRTTLDRGRIERQRRHPSRPIPEGFDYAGVRHLRAEAREQLARIRPRRVKIVSFGRHWLTPSPCRKHALSSLPSSAGLPFRSAASRG